jgi:hypothetical protein
MTVTFKNGDVQTFANAAVQEKDGGEVIAVYDLKTCRILLEFPRELVASWDSADSAAPLAAAGA